MAQGYLELVKELLQPLGHVTSRRMFSSQGVYVDGAFVAIVWRDQVFFKTDAETRPRFQAAGLTPFRPNPNRDYSLGFYPPPGEALDDPEEFRVWAELALAAARRTRAAKQPKKRRRV